MKTFLALLRVRRLEIRLHDAKTAVDVLGKAQQDAYLVSRDIAKQLDEARRHYFQLQTGRLTA